MTGRLIGLSLAVSVLIACDGGDASQEPAAETPSAKCPNVGMDTLDGKWIKYEGSAIKEYRFAVDSTGDVRELWYTAGSFMKRRLRGERRTSDYVFTEVLTGDREQRYLAGALPAVRLYVEPRAADCSLRVSEMEVHWKENQEVERPKGSYATYIEYPAEGPDLPFRYCDHDLFISDAAKDRAVANAQVAESGAAEPGAALGEALALGAWSPAMGEEGCAYEARLYFDDQPARDVAGAFRPVVPMRGDHWLIEDWYAPYSGNHQFEVYQYKTCSGGSPELVGVACLEAVLR